MFSIYEDGGVYKGWIGGNGKYYFDDIGSDTWWDQYDRLGEMANGSKKTSKTANKKEK